MDKFILKIPIGKFNSDESLIDSLKVLSFTKSNAGDLIKSIANYHKINHMVAFSFFAVESKGVMKVSSDGLGYGIGQTNATGLAGVCESVISKDMTLGEFYPLYLKTTEVWDIKKSIPSEKEFWSNAFALQRQDLAKNYVKYKGHNFVKKNAKKWNNLLLKDMEFSIRVPMLILKNRMSECLQQKNGKIYLRIDWVIKGYNMGGTSLRNSILLNKNNQQLDSLQLIQRKDLINQSNTRPYIERIGGVGGYLDLISSGKFIL